jgi:hypothetical protein
MESKACLPLSQEATRILCKHTERDAMSFQAFELYTLRHTCLTGWAPHNVHPQTIRAAMDRARAVERGHTFGHTAQKSESGENCFG